MSPIPFSCLDLCEKSPVLTYSQGIQGTAKEENCWGSPEAHFWAMQLSWMSVTGAQMSHRAEITTMAQQSTGTSCSCFVFSSIRDRVKFKGVFRRPDQSGNSPHVLQFFETSGISTTLCATELKLQGLSLTNCRRIFASSLLHGRPVRRFWRTSITSWFDFILSCNMSGLQCHRKISEPQLIDNIEAACLVRSSAMIPSLIFWRWLGDSREQHLSQTFQLILQCRCTPKFFQSHSLAKAVNWYFCN